MSREWCRAERFAGISEVADTLIAEALVPLRNDPAGKVVVDVLVQPLLAVFLSVLSDGVDPHAPAEDDTHASMQILNERGRHPVDKGNWVSDFKPGGKPVAAELRPDNNGVPPPPGIRNCCMLAKDRGPLPNILEPHPDTYRHVYGSGGFVPADEVGQMYTCAGGFIDFGHVRDVGDLTKFYYDALQLKGHKGDVIEPPRKGVRGTVTILKDVTAAKQVAVARGIAYGEAVYHEIETYWQRTPGKHHSSFSPEDLVSNFFGTFVAASAIRNVGAVGDDYNTRFASALEFQMTELGAVGRTETAMAMDRIEDTWFHGSSLRSGYLLRRNFAVWPLRPWLLDDMLGCPNGKGSFPSPAEFEFAIPADASSHYSVDYEVPEESRGADRINAEVVTGLEFQMLIGSIRTAAQIEYGAEYDSPAPVGRVGP